MKCHGCGHEFTGKSTRCPRCHRSTSRRGRSSNDSRLLEFPRRVRQAPVETTAPVLPAWRIELNEKVRAIRAKRTVSNSQADALREEEEAARPLEVESHPSASAARLDEQRISFSRDANRHAAVAVETREQTAPATSARRTSSNIVEAALTRVKRASENASRAALPKIEPARSLQASSQVGLVLDRQATARALEPVLEIEPRVDLAPAPKPEVIQPPMARPAPIQAPLPERRLVVESPVAVAQSAVSPAPLPDESVEASLPVIDELEPLDYLEAEIRKVDKALGAEFLRNESPSILTHAVIGFVDLLTLALTVSPFLAIIRIADGTFSTTQTRLASVVIVALISFFYLALTQIVGGRTFGMMFTNTRVVDAATFEAPSAPRMLLRTAAYFIAAAPAMLGIIWAAFNHKHRGWQDLMSGTVVVRDF